MGRRASGRAGRGAPVSSDHAETGRRTPAENAELALLLEVAGTPKPGNVDRHRDLENLRFEQFLAGAVGSAAGLRLADDDASVGEAFERAVAGMARRAGANTQFGCLLLLIPLVRAAADGDLSPAGVDAVCRTTTVDDAVDFYRAFEHVDVAVADPPADATALDVRRGSAAEPALREQGLTLRDVMAVSADQETPQAGDDASRSADDTSTPAAADPPTRLPDTNAQEWVEGFPRTFRGAQTLLDDDGPVGERTARLFLEFLAADPDSLVATRHGVETAREIQDRAASVHDEVVETGSLAPAESLAAAFVDESVNPGTTADRTAAALFVALERGLEP